MSNLHPFDLMFIAGYFLILFGIAWWAARREKAVSSDYFLAGRELFRASGSGSCDGLDGPLDVAGHTLGQIVEADGRVGGDGVTQPVDDPVRQLA